MSALEFCIGLRFLVWVECSDISCILFGGVVLLGSSMDHDQDDAEEWLMELLVYNREAPYDMFAFIFTSTISLCWCLYMQHLIIYAWYKSSPGQAIPSDPPTPLPSVQHPPGPILAPVHAYILSYLQYMYIISSICIYVWMLCLAFNCLHFTNRVHTSMHACLYIITCRVCIIEHACMNANIGFTCPIDHWACQATSDWDPMCAGENSLTRRHCCCHARWSALKRLRQIQSYPTIFPNVQAW